MQLSPQQNQLLARIREILDRTDTIVFVGSGISRWSGLPSWYSLIEELGNYVDSQGLSAEIVRKELRANDLLQAASYGIDLLTKSQVAEFMQLACRVETASPHEIHKEIISLGPSCFITTNYDQLLERSFSKWQLDKHIRVITNNQVTETANIIQARSSSFIFKPHGDIDDSESIILTREHYRKLSSDKPSVLSALSTLLASRPVVFLGFGLRDLDFLYVKDILANIYKGGAIDHYAVMPDISEQERSYWRKNFGIHILSYASNKDGSGHEQLLSILQYLNEKVKEAIVETNSKKNLSAGYTPEKILAIARYSANIVHSANIQNESHVPLRISLERKDGFKGGFSQLDAFDYSEVENFLEKYKQNAIIIGNPGSGKSYSLRRVLYKIAQNVQNACLQNEFDIAKFDFPIYLDLKLYDGDIFEMINQILPPDFSLGDLSGFNTIKFFLDSYNELPNIYSDNGKFQDDFSKLLTTFNNSSTIIASRFAEGLNNLNYPVYQIESIDYGFIEKQLNTLNFQLPDQFRREIINLLQKPLFYRLYQEQKITLSSEMTPVDIYKSFVGRISSELNYALNIDISLDGLFKPLAYEILNNGIETFSLNDLETIFAEFFLKNSSVETSSNDVINWLISRDFIIPSPNLRLSFFHQSVTEYFAALELSERYNRDSNVLNEILKYKRWDQCLFLTLSFLNESDTNSFIQKIIKIDILLAIKAAKYLEYNSDSVFLQILVELQNMSEVEYSWSHALSEFPATKHHEEILLQLLKKKGNLGGVAAKLLQKALGRDIKDILIKEMFENPTDYNYCSDLGEALGNILEFDEFQLLFEKAREITLEEKVWRESPGFSNGMEYIAKSFDYDDIIIFFRDWKKYNSFQKYIIAELLRRIESDESLNLLIEMIAEGEESAVSSLYLCISLVISEYKVNWSLLSVDLVRALIDALDIKKIGKWALGCLDAISKERKDLLDYIKKSIPNFRGTKKIALMYCDIDSHENLWSAIESFSNLSLQETKSEPVFLFQELELDWKDKEDIFINLLQIGNFDLDTDLLESLYSFRKGSFDFDFKPISWWLDWMNNIPVDESEHEKNWWILYRLGELLANKASAKAQKLIVDEFNNPDTQYREIILNYILSSIPNLTLESFTDEVISFLMSNLNSKESFSQFNIGSVATESFVEEKLIPLSGNEVEPFKTNLRRAIKSAEDRNKRRFIIGG